MASGGNRSQDLVFLQATRSYVPRDGSIGLAFKSTCIFLLINEHPHRSKDLYFVQNVSGSYGFVPKNRVKKRKMDWMERDKFLETVRKHSHKRKFKTLDQNFCVAIESYHPPPSSTGELTLEKDDVIKILDRKDGGWFFGESNGKKGWFPKYYVHESMKIEGNMPLFYQFTVEARQSFISEASYDLQFSARDRLDIIQRPKSTDDSWVARDREGRIGLIPKSHLDERPDRDSVLTYWPFYHSPCTREAAEYILHPRKEYANHFLLRDSESYPGFFCISATTGVDGRILHLVLQTTTNGYQINDYLFDSLSDVINHHRNHAIFDSAPDRLDGYQTFLRNPVVRQTI